MKKILLSFVFIFIAQASFAQDAAFKKDFKKYLDLSGQMKPFEMLLTQLVERVPDEKKADFQKELKASVNLLGDKMAELYMTEFTHDDVKQMIKFYESPVGKKLNEKSDILLQKGEVLGEEWGMGLQGLMMKYMDLTPEALEE
ncbi:MAG: DUF2059 domain-containing protein [Flavobacteriaceae bacterium]|jgi:hypothetical protein|nr:DUF2059 domain-containing protein [Flavobacteriaceae bacterium]